MTMPAASSPTDPGSAAGSASALTVAGIAALLASGCCVAPLLLALVGVSGAWIGQLRRIEPYSPWLMALSLLALAVAGWRLFRGAPGAAACGVDDVPCRRVNLAARRWFWAVALLALVPLAAPLVAPWFY
jgi:mercuric ion transport protein